MLNFMISGGFVMWPVLLFGLAGLFLAVGFARRPLDGKPAVIRALTAATGFSALAGVAANVAATMRHIAGNPEWANSPDIHLIVMQGLGESCSPAILGFGILGIVWLLAAVGARRLEIELDVPAT